MVVGRSYGYREKRGPDQPILKIKLLDKVGRKGKIKVVFETGPHPGLEEYIDTRQALCPWGERNEILRDEKHAAALAAYTHGVRDSAPATADPRSRRSPMCRPTGVRSTDDRAADDRRADRLDLRL
jgi:hypothetical protein